MEFNLFNIGVVKLSILILFIICIALIGLTFSLAIALWKMRDKFRIEQLRFKQYSVNLHPLTSLANRQSLMEALDDLLNSSKESHANIAVLFIDIDDFNSINGSLGVKIGDYLLQSVASIIIEEVSAFSKFIFHVGSDEFVVVLYDFGTDTSNVADIANDIIHAVDEPINIHGYDLHVTCCIGICTYPECASDTEELLKFSGSARDIAKKNGFGSFAFYSQEMSKQSIVRSLISADLRKALERDEFYLHYQPKIRLSTGTVQGAEALLRWNHPSLGNITPDIFIPVMEDLGLIHAAGKWVIQTACREMSRLHRDGFGDLRIAINLSAHQFDKGDIASIIAEAIWESGIAPHQVELELTEAVVMNDTEKSLLMLKVLQSMGVKIAVDDFGTGYSSMNQLTRFPVNILKVDRCFIHDMHKIPANMTIVSTIINMSKQLGFEVVAEGVECIEELEILRNEGCDIIQGFYYSKPLPFSEFAKYVRHTNGLAIKDQDSIESEENPKSA